MDSKSNMADKQSESSFEDDFSDDCDEKKSYTPEPR